MYEDDFEDEILWQLSLLVLSLGYIYLALGWVHVEINIM